MIEKTFLKSIIFQKRNTTVPAVMDNIQTSAIIQNLENAQSTHDNNRMETTSRPNSSIRIHPNYPLKINSISSFVSEREMIKNPQVISESTRSNIANNCSRSVTASGHETRHNNWTVDDSAARTQGAKCKFPSGI